MPAINIQPADSGPWPSQRPHPRHAGDPELLHRVEVPHPDLPESLDGLTVMHFTDAHVRRGYDGADADAPDAQATWWRGVLDAVSSVQVDLAVFTGDWCDELGQEASATRALCQLAVATRTRLGCFGVFGNHDNPTMRRMARQQVPICWMGRRTKLIRPDLRLLGMDFPEDSLGTMLDCGLVPAADAEAAAPTSAGRRPFALDPFVITLAHSPSVMLHGAELGLPLIFAGHTHGGQVRVPLRPLSAVPFVGGAVSRWAQRTLGGVLAPNTSSDMPGFMASGVLGYRRTLCCVSRGLGDSVAELARANCPRQIALYRFVRANADQPLPDTSRPTRLIEF
jgi:predicted MPP superfamily phosphohydrolase